MSKNKNLYQDFIDDTQLVQKEVDKNQYVGSYIMIGSVDADAKRLFFKYHSNNYIQLLGMIDFLTGMLREELRRASDETQALMKQARNDTGTLQ